MNRLIIEPPCAFLTANQRLHWRKKAELTKAWRRATKEAAFDIDATFTRARIICSIRWPDNRRRDPGNWFVTAKACVDGLVDAGVLEDDDSERVVGPDMRREKPNGPTRLTLEIREIK